MLRLQEKQVRARLSLEPPAPELEAQGHEARRLWGLKGPFSHLFMSLTACPWGLGGNPMRPQSMHSIYPLDSAGQGQGSGMGGQKGPCLSPPQTHVYNRRVGGLGSTGVWRFGRNYGVCVCVSMENEGLCESILMCERA